MKQGAAQPFTVLDKWFFDKTGAFVTSICFEAHFGPKLGSAQGGMCQ
jgi:hypothetical protein